MGSEVSMVEVTKTAEASEHARAIGELATEVAGLRTEIAAIRGLLTRTPCDVAEQRRRHRDERLLAVAVGETPVSLREGPLLVLHVLPEAAFLPQASPVKLERAPNFPIFRGGGDPTFNADGKIIWSGERTEGSTGYAQLGRHGCIEAVRVMGNRSSSANDKGLPVRWPEELIVDGTTEYLKTLVSLEVQGAVEVAAALVGVKGWYVCGSDWDRSAYPLRIERQVIALPPVTLELDQPEEEIPERPRPVLDALWQVGGWPRCFHFAEDGTYHRR